MVDEITVRELLDKWVDMHDDTKRWAGQQLYSRLTMLSRNTMLDFQTYWDPLRSYEEFSAAQRDRLRELVDLESSEMGKLVRHSLHMPEDLNYDTVLRKD